MKFSEATIREVLEDNWCGADVDSFIQKARDKEIEKQRRASCKTPKERLITKLFNPELARAEILRWDVQRIPALKLHRMLNGPARETIWKYLLSCPARITWNGVFDRNVFVFPMEFAGEKQALSVSDLEVYAGSARVYVRRLAIDVARLVEKDGLNPEFALASLFFDKFHVPASSRSSPDNLKETQKGVGKAKPSMVEGSRRPKARTCALAIFLTTRTMNLDWTPSSMPKRELHDLWNQACKKIGKGKWAYTPTDSNSDRVDQFWRDCKKAIEIVRRS